MLTVAERGVVLQTAVRAYTHYNSLAPGFSISNALTYALEEHEEELVECSREDESVLMKELIQLIS